MDSSDGSVEILTEYYIEKLTQQIDDENWYVYEYELELTEPTFLLSISKRRKYYKENWSRYRYENLITECFEGNYEKDTESNEIKFNTTRAGRPEDKKHFPYCKGDESLKINFSMLHNDSEKTYTFKTFPGTKFEGLFGILQQNQE
jgi:hypothetical protein